MANPFTGHSEASPGSSSSHLQGNEASGSIDEDDSFQNLTMEESLGTDSARYFSIQNVLNNSRISLSFKRKQPRLSQNRRFSRFLSNIRTSARGNRPGPTIQAPISDTEYDLSDAGELPLEQGIAKEMGDWTDTPRIAARKYDDLTAIGTFPS